MKKKEKREKKKKKSIPEAARNIVLTINLFSLCTQ